MTARLDRAFGARGSLQRNVSVTILVSLLVAMAMSAAVLIHEFFEHLEEKLEAELTREAAEVLIQTDPARPHHGLEPDALRYRGNAGAYRYTVFDEDLNPVAGSEVTPEVLARLPGLPPMIPATFELPGDRPAMALCDLRGGKRVCVLASSAGEGEDWTTVQTMLHEIGEQLQWVVAGALLVLVAAILATRLSLRPLDDVLREARDIGPSAPDRRLSTQGLASEIVPLVEAVNGAFDRLEKGLRAQREFSSNVAHEVRTPLAVLRSGIDRIEDKTLKARLKQDLSGLETIFEQLIDLARADALGPASFTDVTLDSLAVQISSDRALEAVRAGKTLAVGGDTGVHVRGNAGLLAIAIDNLVRNALAFTPEGGEVELDITAHPPQLRVMDRGPGIPETQRAALFERFHRGEVRHEGAGIGLAIVKSVAEAHGATVRIEYRPGGGSIFVLAFPEG